MGKAKLTHEEKLLLEHAVTRLRLLPPELLKAVDAEATIFNIRRLLAEAEGKRIPS